LVPRNWDYAHFVHVESIIFYDPSSQSHIHLLFRNVFYKIKLFYSYFNLIRIRLQMGNRIGLAHDNPLPLSLSQKKRMITFREYAPRLLLTLTYTLRATNTNIFKVQFIHIPQSSKIRYVVLYTIQI